MYLGFYKLKEIPFRLAPDPRFMFWSAGHSAAFELLRNVQEQRDGCTVIVGERGAGKTGLLECLRQQLPRHVALRIDFPPRTMSDLLEWLHAGDEGVAPAGRVIVCDNSHLFHETMLAALLSGGAGPGARVPNSRVILAGEPQLLRTLAVPELVFSGRRRCERFHLPPLTAAEVTEYIRHRLEIAGANGARIFRDEVFAEISRETRGNPRLVNALCDAAMTVACERELREIGPAEIRRAFEDIGRLVALQAEEREASTPRTPPDADRAAPARSVFARLQLTRGDQLILERELASGNLRIGRSLDNDLCIENRYVSRHHCRILTRQHRCVLEEVHSTNGLYVNDRRVHRHNLRDGDVVQIGEHLLRYFDLRDLRKST